ncbi:MAG: rubrerythrin family protein [Kiritimatiellae bacterium]|jgi:hypothetical protein|nr:rubrerythrin family protein [Kiritimatiellia bacterium]
MKNDLQKIIDESIKLEQNIAATYLFFKENFKEDESFWWKLVVEEKHHAALIRSAKMYFDPVEQFPARLLATTLEELTSTNETFESYLKKFRESTPTREEAFNLALVYESSAGEIHFQNFMMKNSNAEIDKVFQQLNGDDVNHFKRIKAYMLEHDIKVKEPAD